MNLLKLFFAGLVFTFGMNALSAVQYEGGLREFFLTPYEYHFGSDHAAQIKRETLEAGAQSIVLHLRLGVQSATSHVVFHPAYKTRPADLDVVLSRILQADGRVVFKPGLYENPEFGTPSAITLMESDDPHSFFTSYGQSLQLYQSIAIQREVSVFAVGMGLGKMMRSEFSPRWKAMVLNLKKNLRTKTKLALELSHSNDLSQLEKWVQENPVSFYEAMGPLDQIRFTLPLKEYVKKDSLLLDSVMMRKLIQNRYARLAKLFPEKSIVLANVILPGCFDFEAKESEVECPSLRPTDPTPAFTAQTKLVRDFLAYFKQINQEMSHSLAGLELLFSNTDYEPAYGQSDARFPFFNKDAYQEIKKGFIEEKNKDVSILFKSSKSSFLPRSSRDPIHQKTACIYFDEQDENDIVGPIHARLLENVLGAFKNWRRERRSVLLYESGDLKSCDAVFYLASNFNLKAPVSFYPEISEFMQKKPVAWFNYKIDQLHKFFKDNKLTDPLAFDTPLIFQALSPPTKLNTDPGFYRYFDYKGETFFKEAKFDQLTGRYMSSPELNQIRIFKPELIEVKATARHSKDNSIVPYVVTQNISEGSFWYFADLPFSFIHYEDRYLIFCDLVWDILKEPTPATKPIALVRIEDVNASDQQEDLMWTVNYLHSENVPFSLALIPYYSNLFHDPFNDAQSNSSLWQPAYLNQPFTGFIRYAQALGADFVMHGVAHQSGDLISGYHGISGADYEFWLYPDNRPMPEDSSDWFVRKITKGEEVFRTLGIRPVAWETPHYASSVLDSYILGKTFEWNYHRSPYFKSELVSDVSLDQSKQFYNCITPECRSQRELELSKLQVKVDYRNSGAQFLPFITYKDSYGQAVIPETIGMIDFPMYPQDTWRPMGYPEDLLRRAKKLRVIRGAVASFFWHSSVLRRDNIFYRTVPGSFDSIGGAQTLEKTIRGIKALGYQFVSISDCKYFPQPTCKSKE